jgi:hypothetical protein
MSATSSSSPHTDVLTRRLTAPRRSLLPPGQFADFSVVRRQEVIHVRERRPVAEYRARRVAGDIDVCLAPQRTTIDGHWITGLVIAFVARGALVARTLRIWRPRYRTEPSVVCGFRFPSLIVVRDDDVDRAHRSTPSVPRSSLIPHGGTKKTPGPYGTRRFYCSGGALRALETAESLEILAQLAA